LVGWIKYDMQRTAASQRAGMNSVTDSCAQLTRLSAWVAAAVTPTLAVAYLLGRVARFQLAQRVMDRGERYRDAVVLQRLADLSRSDRGWCHRLQDLFDDKRIATT